MAVAPRRGSQQLLKPPRLFFACSDQQVQQPAEHLAAGSDLAAEQDLRWDAGNHDLFGAIVNEHLNARAATIFGGAQEIQLGIIAKTYAEL